MSKEKIATKLKSARENLGLRQEDVASYLGTTVQKVSSFETSRTRIDIDTLVKLCNFYNIDVNEVLNAKPDRESFSLDEKNLIKKYRTLDKSGKDTVDVVLDTQYERCKADNVIDMVAEPMADYLKPKAAHQRTDIDVPEDVDTSDDDIMKDF